MVNKLRKLLFFFSQLTLKEFFNVAQKKMFGERSDLLKNTYQFLEDRFKDNSLIVKHGLLSKISLNLNSVRVSLFLRRFSSDVLVYRQIIIKKEFEPVIDLFKKHDFIPEYIMDGGGNIGLSTIYLKSFFSDAKFAVIEPNIKNYAILEMNISTNSFSNCKLFQYGLWSENTSLSASYEQAGDEWGFSVRKKLPGDGDAIVGRTIESIMADLNWPRIDYLKLDIEGAEEELFRDFNFYEGFIKKTYAISIEPHTHTFKKQFMELLHNYHFSVHEFGELVVGLKSKFNT